VVASVPYSNIFASRSETNYDVTEAWIANKFVFLDFYVAALSNLRFTICGSYIEQVWPPLPSRHFRIHSFYLGNRHTKKIYKSKEDKIKKQIHRIATQ